MGGIIGRKKTATSTLISAVFILSYSSNAYICTRTSVHCVDIHVHVNVDVHVVYHYNIQ